MDDILRRIIDEKQLIKNIKEKGLDGYYTERIDGGYLYRFLLKDGSWEEIVNLSKTGQKQLKLD